MLPIAAGAARGLPASATVVVGSHRGTMSSPIVEGRIPADNSRNRVQVFPERAQRFVTTELQHDCGR